jgi:hypothetical protein
LIENVSPVIYFDFTTGSGTTAVDSAPLLFDNPRGFGNPQTARVAIPESPLSVDTSLGYGGTGYTFDASKLNAFEILSTDANFSDYSEIFDSEGVILFWANFRVSDVSSGTGQNTAMQIRGKDGADDSMVSFEYSNSGANERRLRCRINNNNGVNSVATDSNSIKNTIDFYNVATLIDTRTGQGTVYMTHSGSMHSSKTVAIGEFLIGTDNANLGFLLGAEKVSALPQNYFDGTIARMGCMNMGATPPDYITGAIQTLFDTDGVPNSAMDGF